MNQPLAESCRKRSRCVAFGCMLRGVWGSGFARCSMGYKLSFLVSSASQRTSPFSPADAQLWLRGRVLAQLRCRFFGLKVGVFSFGLGRRCSILLVSPLSSRNVKDITGISIPALPTTIFVDSEMAWKLGATATARVAAQCSVSSQNHQGYFRSLRPRSRKIYEKRTALF